MPQQLPFPGHDSRQMSYNHNHYQPMPSPYGYGGFNEHNFNNYGGNPQSNHGPGPNYNYQRGGGPGPGMFPPQYDSPHPMYHHPQQQQDYMGGGDAGFPNGGMPGNHHNPNQQNVQPPWKTDTNGQTSSGMPAASGNEKVKFLLLYNGFIMHVIL